MKWDSLAVLIVGRQGGGAYWLTLPAAHTHAASRARETGIRQLVRKVGPGSDLWVVTAR